MGGRVKLRKMVVVQQFGNFGVRQLIALGVIAFGFVLIGQHPAFAQKSPYTVADVAVDATAASASEARDVALANGYLQAYRALVQRNTPKGYWQSVPQMNAEEIQGLVQSFSVSDEKSSRTRYLAKLNVDFKDEAVRQLFRSAGVPFSETISQPILVLPVWQVRGKAILWGSPNPWREAWMQAPSADSGLLPIMLPDGDLEDLKLIDGPQAAAPDRAALAAIAERYGVDKVAVSFGKVLVERETDNPYAEITTFVYGSSGDFNIVDRQYVPGTDRTAFFTKLAETAIADLNEDWKNKTLVHGGEAGRINVVVPIQNLDQWVAIRKTIESTSAVQGLKISALSVDTAIVDLSFRGGLGQLAFSLNERGLQLTQEGQNYVLRQRGQLKR